MASPSLAKSGRLATSGTFGSWTVTSSSTTDSFLPHTGNDGKHFHCGKQYPLSSLHGPGATVASPSLTNSGPLATSSTSSKFGTSTTVNSSLPVATFLPHIGNAGKHFHCEQQDPLLFLHGPRESVASPSFTTSGPLATSTSSKFGTSTTVNSSLLVATFLPHIGNAGKHFHCEQQDPLLLLHGAGSWVASPSFTNSGPLATSTSIKFGTSTTVNSSSPVATFLSHIGINGEHFHSEQDSLPSLHRAGATVASPSFTNSGPLATSSTSGPFGPSTLTSSSIVTSSSTTDSFLPHIGNDGKHFHCEQQDLLPSLHGPGAAMASPSFTKSGQLVATSSLTTSGPSVAGPSSL